MQLLSSESLNVPLLLDDSGKTDWLTLQKRVAAAEELYQLVLLKHPMSWETLQVVIWRLHKRNSYYVNNAGDLLVLKTLYKTIENKVEPIESLNDITATQFKDLLKQNVKQYAGRTTLFANLLEDIYLSENDWTYICYQWLCSAVDFSKYIACASLQLPLQQACILYENLYDESGQGDYKRAHFVELGKIFSKLNIDVNDEATMLSWCAPQVVAHVNTLVYLLINSNLYVRLGALFAIEQLMPDDSFLIGNAMREAGLKIGQEKYFYLHEETDVKHAEQWLTVIEEMAKTPEQKLAVYQGMVTLGQAQQEAWNGAYHGWQYWRGTGKKQTLPFNNLAMGIYIT